MKCLVTGGAGFIGSHLVDALLARGHEVIVIDDLSEGKRENLAHCMGRIEFFHDTILNEALLKRAMPGVDWVFHQAALRAVPWSFLRPAEYHEVNITGTYRLLVAARDAGVKRFVFASSSSVYGNVERFPQDEGMPCAPISPYALTKVAGELYLRMFQELYGLETVSLRYFNVFGPRQDPTSQYAIVVPLFIDILRRAQSPEVHGDGLQAKDFTYIQNVVDANLLAATTAGVGGQVFNIGCGESHSVLELLSILQRLLGTNIAHHFGPPREGDVRRSQADIARAREVLGYAPAVGFGEGLRRMVEAFVQDSPAN